MWDFLNRVRPHRRRGGDGGRRPPPSKMGGGGEEGRRGQGGHNGHSDGEEEGCRTDFDFMPASSCLPDEE